MHSPSGQCLSTHAHDSQNRKSSVCFRVCVMGVGVVCCVLSCLVCGVGSRWAQTIEKENTETETRKGREQEEREKEKTERTYMTRETRCRRNEMTRQPSERERDGNKQKEKIER